MSDDGSAGGSARAEDQASGRPVETLRLLCGRFAGGFSSAASELVGCDVHVGGGRWGKLPYSDFLSSISEPLCCCSVGVTVPPARPRQAWIEISLSVARAMIDAMFGVTPASQQGVSANRPPTLVEQRLLLRVMASAVECLGRAWPGDGAPHLRLLEGPLGGAPLDGSAGGEAVMVLTFELGLAGRVGQLRFCLPAGMLGEGVYTPASQERTGPVELSAALAETDMPRNELEGLAVGDIITTDTSVDGEVVVRVAGIPKYRARLGACDGRRAVTITRGISDDPPAEEGQLPGEARPETP